MLLGKKSFRNGSTESGFVLGIIFVIVAGYFILTTDNPIRDALKDKAFEMAINHVKSKFFGN